MPNINAALPGFQNVSSKVMKRIDDMLSGRLSQGTQDNIQNAAATQAVRSGMPGTSRIGGSLGGNRVLRDLGLTTEGQADAGIKSLLQTLQAYSGSAFPTTGQEMQQGQFDATMQNNQSENRMQRLLAERMNKPKGKTIGIRKFDAPFAHINTRFEVD